MLPLVFFFDMEGVFSGRAMILWEPFCRWFQELQEQLPLGVPKKGPTLVLKMVRYELVELEDGKLKRTWTNFSWWVLQLVQLEPETIVISH